MENTIQLYSDIEKRNKVYPITSPDRVIDENGINIKEHLDNKASKNEVDTKVWSMANMGQDVKTAMTGGSVAVVGDNSVLTQNIVNNQVTPIKTDFFERSTNLFNKYTCKKGVSISTSSGQETANATAVASDFFDLKEGENTYCKVGHLIYYYNSSKTYITFYDNSNANPRTRVAPANTSYARIVFWGFENIDICMLSKTTSESQFKEPYLIPKNKLANLNINKDDIAIKGVETHNTTFFEETYNLFDVNKASLNTILSTGSGNPSPNVDNNCSDFIAVKSNTIYRSNVQHLVYFYDSNKAFISWADRTNKNPIYGVTPSNCAFVRIVVNKVFCNDINKISFWEGQEAKPFINRYAIPSKYLFKAESKWAGKKIVGYGDSMTADQTWQDLVNGYLGSIKIPRGIGGTTVQEKGTVAWVDSEGNYVSRPPATQPDGTIEIKSSMVNDERIATIPTDADCIIFFGGANDWDGSTQAFKDAYRLTLDKLYARCPNARVILIAVGYHNECDNPAPNEGYKAIRTSIEEIAKDYGYPLIKLKDEMGVNKLNHASFMADNIHWAEKGNERIAQLVIDMLKKVEPLT